MPEKILIYHNNQCSKSREALQLLNESGVDFETIEYLKNVPSPKEIKSLLKMLGLKAHDLMRKGEDAYKEFVKDRELTEEQLIALMVTHPKLIERPIIIHGNKAIIGRPPTVTIDFISKAK